MIDRLGRNITYLRISVTDKCNLRCRYCMPEDGVCKKDHADMLTEDEIITAVEAAAALGITKIRITGGEPLVKKNIVSICRRAAAVEGIKEVCLTTNGLLLPQLAKPLKEAGVKRLNLSLDTLDPEKYAYITRIGKLYDVSAVSIPANDGTEISARSLVDGLIEKEKAERHIEAEKEARAKAKAALATAAMAAITASGIHSLAWGFFIS